MIKEVMEKHELCTKLNVPTFGTFLAPPQMTRTNKYTLMKVL